MARARGILLDLSIFEGALCAPLVAVVGKWLLGQRCLIYRARVVPALTARDSRTLFTAITLMTVRLVEHARLSAIFYGAFQGRRVPALEAGRIVWRDLLALVRVSARFVGIGLVTALPLLMVAGGFAIWLLLSTMWTIPEDLNAGIHGFRVRYRGGCSNYCSGRGSARGALALGRPGSDLRGKAAARCIDEALRFRRVFGGNWPV